MIDQPHAHAQHTNTAQHTNLHRKGPKCHDDGITGYGLWQEGGVCFIGIAPGVDEVRTGTPFVGESGRLLDATLLGCDWSRAQSYTTNLLCWWKNDPTYYEIMDCWPRLHNELAQLKPKLIVPLGAIATDFLLGNVAGDFWEPVGLDYNVKAWSTLPHDMWPTGEAYGGWGTRRGRTTWCTALSAYVMPSYHPSGILRGNTQNLSDLARDLWKINTVIGQFAPDGRESDYTFSVIDTIADGQRVLDNLPRGITSTSAGVAIDIETNYGEENIDIFTEDLLCLSLTWGWSDTVVIPGSIAKQLDWSRLDNINWIGQNLVFDMNGIRKWCKGPTGCDDTILPVSEDTMLQSYALDERSGVHRLEQLGGEWCAAPLWKSELNKYRFTRSEIHPVSGRRILVKYKAVPLDVLYKYNAGDTTYTYRTHVRQLPFVVADGMEHVYRDILLPAANAFAQIQYRGIHIDTDKADELLIDWYRLWIEQEAELQDIVAENDPTLQDIGLNFGSSKQMQKFLYETLKLPKQYNNDPKRSTRRLTSDKDALDTLAPLHPFCGKLKAHRQTDHSLASLKGILSRIKDDNMYHVAPLIHGTETGRLSYKPNVQNLSQWWNVGYRLARIREVFAAKNPDTHFIAEVDYAQIELWTGAWQSQDQQMLADLQGGDFHTMATADMLSKPADQVTKDERFFSKAITFGMCNRRGPQAMIDDPHGLNTDIHTATLWCNKWKARYATFEKWVAGVQRTAQIEGILVSPWGRKRRFYMIRGEHAHHDLRSAVNFMLQSPAHDYTLASLILLQDRLTPYDSYILFETHDSISFEISREHAQVVFNIIRQTMESVRPTADWPTLKVEFKTGPNWGTATEACKTCHQLYPLVTVQSNGYCTVHDPALTHQPHQPHQLVAA